jgi:small subunit ribosomal protein S12
MNSIFKNTYQRDLKKSKNKEKNKRAKREVMYRAIVLNKTKIDAKQPNSGKRKCVKVQRLTDNKKLYVFCPGDGAIEFIEEHDEILVSGVGTKGGRAKGDIPGISWQAIKINGVCLKSLVNGKKNKKIK